MAGANKAVPAGAMAITGSAPIGTLRKSRRLLQFLKTATTCEALPGSRLADYAARDACTTATQR
jgi:hypothetical protein